MTVSPQLVNCGFLVLGVFFGAVITSAIEVWLHRAVILNLLSFKNQLQQLTVKFEQAMTDMLIHQNRNQERVDALEQESCETAERLENFIDDMIGDEGDGEVDKDDCDEEELPERNEVEPQTPVSQKLDEFWENL